MDNKDSFKKFVEIVVNNANKKIKVGDVLTILQLISKSIEEDKEMDVRLANTIIFGIIAGLATILDCDESSEVLDSCIKDLKDSLA